MCSLTLQCTLHHALLARSGNKAQCHAVCVRHLHHAWQLPELKQSCHVEEAVKQPSEASASESSGSRSAEAAPVSAPAPAKAAPAVSSADSEAVQLNQLPSQDTSAPPAPPQQPAQQPMLQAVAKPSVSGDDSVPAGAQQPQPASNAAATKPAGQDQQKQQQQAESAVQPGSGAAAAKTESAPSSAGGAWGGTKSFRDIAAGNKPDKVCPCFCSGPCTQSTSQHSVGFQWSRSAVHASKLSLARSSTSRSSMSTLAR